MSPRREQFGATGGFGDALRRIFGDGENPLNWALPLYKAWGIAVRVHLIFVIWIVAQLIISLLGDRMGLGFTALGLGSLFGIVLLHEYGHCFACRRVNGDADQILLWPLGGLASCMPPDTWRAHLITVLGGPAVNVLLLPVFGAAVLIATGGNWQAVVWFNPFHPGGVINTLVGADGNASYLVVSIWLIHYTNLVLLAFNVLLPMYPMDGGRIVHALLWRRLGRRRATEIATTIGLVAAVVVAVVAIVGQETLLLGIALFGGITCWWERHQLRAMGQTDFGYDFSQGYSSLPDDEEIEEPGPSRRERKRAEREEAEQAELDRILAKISDDGMGALSRRERSILKRATERRQQQ